MTAKLLIAALVAGLGFWVQQLRLEVSRLETEAAQVRVDAQEALRLREAAILKKEQNHAVVTKGLVDGYEKEKQRLAGQRDTERQRAHGLRQQLAAATRNATGDSSDPAACERDRDRLAELGELAGEGAELVAEARHLLETSGQQVTYLRDQLLADRAACQAP